MSRNPDLTLFVHTRMTVAKLKRRYKSMPVNPLLARAMYMRGYIEHVGSGTGDIIERCRAKGLPPPIWENEDDGCVVTIKRPAVPGQGKNAHDPLKGTDQVSDQVSDQVVSLVCACGDGWKTAAALRSAVAITHLHFFRMKYLRPAVGLGLVEMSQPESPRAPTRKYRLTDKGRSLAAQLLKKKGGVVKRAVSLLGKTEI